MSLLNFEANQRYLTVHYEGRILGASKPFDSSYDRAEPLVFKLGVGQVIPCWDEGLKNAKQKDVVKLVCPPEKAYGSQGVRGVIPPNATLQFDIIVLKVSQRTY